MVIWIIRCVCVLMNFIKCPWNNNKERNRGTYLKRSGLSRTSYFLLHELTRSATVEFPESSILCSSCPDAGELLADNRGSIAWLNSSPPSKPRVTSQIKVSATPPPPDTPHTLPSLLADPGPQILQESCNRGGVSEEKQWNTNPLSLPSPLCPRVQVRLSALTTTTLK